VPLITIVIPTFERAELLSKLLDALRNEILTNSFKDKVELIVVDNCPDGSARATVEAAADVVSYLHEPRTGVANARNRGVEAARGAYILFIDDDELPRYGWLAAFYKQAADNVDACFGPVEPEFVEQPPPELQEMLERIFSRSIPAKTGEDISAWRPYLGTGNSMFKKDVCFPEGMKFHPNFNGGGEDVWLLRQLVDDMGVRLIWCNEAKVSELVPSSRMTYSFVQRRKFRDGQLRCIVEASAGGLKAVWRVTLWMTIGLVQTMGGLLFYACFYPLNRTRATGWKMRSVGGLGKLLWWRDKVHQA
jgi:glycosyltransferase involved in cell wall biosynthesis